MLYNNIYLLLAKEMSPYEFNDTMTMVQLNTGDINIVEVGRYNFLHYELSTDYVYVIEKDMKFRPQNAKKIQEDLEEKGFTYKVYNNFLIYTYQE